MRSILMKSLALMTLGIERFQDMTILTAAIDKSVVVRIGSLLVARELPTESFLGGNLLHCLSYPSTRQGREHHPRHLQNPKNYFSISRILLSLVRRIGGSLWCFRCNIDSASPSSARKEDACISTFLMLPRLGRVRNFCSQVFCGSLSTSTRSFSLDCTLADSRMSPGSPRSHKRNHKPFLALDLVLGRNAL